VLVDSERIYFETNRDYLARHSLELSENAFCDLFLVQDLGISHLLATRGLSPEDIARCRAERNDLYTKRLLSAGSLVMPGIKTVLERFHTRARMAIVTSSRSDHFQTIHRNTGLLEFFEFVLTADDYARSKPAPDPYFKALKTCALRADECVVVEDSPRGLAAARAAGIDCIVVRTPLTRNRDFPGACEVVDSVSQLAAALESRLPSAAL
jgi:HAD superfamily hydrolase (TIGR01509 family)